MYRVAAPWVLAWRDRVVRVPAGFKHDGASVPRGVWSLTGLRPDGLLRAAALAHDWVYRWAGRVPDDDKPWKRAEADAMFYDVMVGAGVPAWRARIAWLGVRSGGWIAWRQNSRRQR